MNVNRFISSEKKKNATKTNGNNSPLGTITMKSRPSDVPESRKGHEGGAGSDFDSSLSVWVVKLLKEVVDGSLDPVKTGDNQ